MVPLAPLPDLAAHEQQLLAGVHEHVAVERPQVGVLLPHVAGHLVEHRAFAVHDLVVRERQDELLAVGVHHREGDPVVVPLAMHRIFLHVVEHVVHPAHVPLVGETQAAEVHRARHARPRRRLLRAHERARRIVLDQHVELLDELDRLDVFAAAVLVGHPLAFLARVIEIQHRRHGVDAQPVDVEFVQPEERVAEQERPHFVAAVIEDQRAPVLVLALARVRMFVERRAVEARQAVLILGKMPGHPVENHADARLVKGIDQELEILGRTVTAGRREKSDHLVAPRPGVGMFHHGQELDVREAHVLDVRHQPLRHLPIGVHVATG